MPKKKLLVTLILIVILWSSSQAVVTAYQGLHFESIALTNSISKRAPDQEIVDPAPATEGAVEGSSSWFLTDDESQWSEQEVFTVQQIMERTWQALESVGLDGESLLAGYHFRRLAAEFVPGEERLLAIVDHQKMEIILSDGAFKRLHGFYIYHEVGHAVDRQLERLPSEAYHRIAGEGQPGATEESDAWKTVTGFWLRYAGRDDREEATADAFAWWVMAQADQPKPVFPGTPVTTDYSEIAGTIEAALAEVVTSGS